MTFIVKDGAVRDVRIRGQLVLDAIYVAVRDEAWGTHPATVREVSGGATTVLHGEHGGPDPVFAWDGVVEDDGSTVRFTMHGTVLREFTGCRVGVCLLHPLGLAGRDFLASTPSGERRGSFSERIEPDPPASGFTALRYDTFEIVLDGGLFEMEDHRNWTDPGWKSYSPPLGHQGVRTYRAGEEIVQSVTVRGPVHLDTIGKVAGVVPEISRDHVDLVEGEPVPSTVHARSVSLVYETPGWLNEATAAVGLAARVAVFGRRSNTTAEGDPGRVRALLRARGCQALVGGGSRLHFAELNRLEVDTGDWDFCTFPITPQAHHCDTASVMATVRAQPTAVEQARRVAPVVVGPLAFRARTSPTAPAHPDDPVDPRERGPIGATWLLASVIAMHRAEAILVSTDAEIPPALTASQGQQMYVVTDPRGLFAAIIAGTAYVANIGEDPIGVVFNGDHAVVAGYGTALLTGTRTEEPEPVPRSR